MIPQFVSWDILENNLKGFKRDVVGLDGSYAFRNHKTFSGKVHTKVNQYSRTTSQI